MEHLVQEGKQDQLQDWNWGKTPQDPTSLSFSTMRRETEVSGRSWRPTSGSSPPLSWGTALSSECWETLLV